MTKYGLWRDTRGYAVVEATFLFPIMIMVFAGVVLLATYLPLRSSLQRSTQYAATAIATEHSDTWLRHDAGKLEYYWLTDRDQLGSVYGSVLKAISGNGQDDEDNARQIVINMEKNGFLKPSANNLEVEFGVVNYIVYKEIIVTATRTVKPPVDLSFVGFPKEIKITVTSTAVVQNGDEFIRNVDIATDFIEYLGEKFSLDKYTDGFKKFFGKFNELLGI